MAMTSAIKTTMTALLPGVCAVLMLALTVTPARAQNWFSDTYPDFFQLQQPGQLDVTGFLGGYVSDKYGTTQEGFQLEQSVTKYVGVFGRLTGYQLWIGEGFDSPLQPGAGHFARLNFGRAQGGVDFTLYQGTHFFISGGKDFGDSNADIIEGDFSSWLLLHSLHPVNFSFSAIHNFENQVTSAEIDIQAILMSTEKYIVMAGAGGAMYRGGFVEGSGEGQGGPDLAFYYRPWRVGLGAQAGYGNAHQYGQLTMYKELSLPE